MQRAFFVGVLVVVTVAFLWLLWGFLQPIFWATILAILFAPVQSKLKRTLGPRPSLAAFLTLLIIVATVLAPASLVISAVLQEAGNLYDRIQAGDIDPAAPLHWLDTTWPEVTRMAARFGINMSRLKQELSNAALTLSRSAATFALVAGESLLRFAVMFVLMLYLLFFALRDGDRLVEHLARAVPLGNAREKQLFAKFAEVSRATIKGSLVIALVQGSLGGAMFWILGIEGALLWGVVMVLFSLVPAVGSAIVWVPAALVLLAKGLWIKALVLAGFGVFVIALADNLLRPRLVGRDTQLPDFLVLLSTLGGVSIAGFSGLIIGPTIAALFLAVWMMFEAELRAA